MWASQVALKKPPADAGNLRHGVPSLGLEHSLEESAKIHSSVLPEFLLEFQGQRNLVGHSPKAHKELDMTEVTQHAR